MNNKFSQQAKFLQKMTLTPQMKHSIQLLGMSVMELNDYIDSVLASNPFLEKHAVKQSNRMNGLASPDFKDDMQIKDEVNPREFLLSQVRTLNLGEKELEIAEYLIYELDDSGYIKADSDAIAQDLFTDEETVEGVLAAIQTLDPPGIGARDIKECLQIQLARLGKETSLEYTIVTNYLSDVAINDIPRIANFLDTDKAIIQKCVDFIRTLNPRPGSTLLSKGADKIIPDLTAKFTDKKVRLELNRESIPRLRLYNPYENKLDVIKDPQAKEFLKENMGAANQLLDNIKRREETMCRVAEYILNHQKENCVVRSQDIKTLTLKDVADALGLHRSTISRAASNKFIQIGAEVICLKSFFSDGMKKENGEITSKAGVKNRIKKLVNEENKAKPISDKIIRDILAQEGIVLERRTIAKYRESLRILPRHLRKDKSA